MSRILALGAHPDDIEILCGGTLAKYAEKGDKVFMAPVTDGSMGHARIMPSELAKIREREVRESAEVIGAELIWVGLPDEFLLNTEETRLKIIDVIRTAKPDLIITHPPESYHPDHCMTSQLVFDASFMCTIPHIETAHSMHEKVVPILYMDTLAGLNFQPEIYVDITKSFDRKKEMLSKHKSQVTWLKEHDNIDILNFMEVVSAFRGIQCNVKYAEGFRMRRTWPRVPVERLLP